MSKGMAVTLPGPSAASFSRATASMPADGSARTMLPTSAASSSPSSPVPAPMSMARMDRDSGTWARMMSAMARARSRRSGVSQSWAFSSNVLMSP